MNTRVIPKETNYQKWLNDYKIHCNSEDVIIGNIYSGYAVIDGGVIQSPCRTVYYDAERRVLLAEDIDSNTYLFIHGRMYVYENVIYFERYNAFRGKQSLYEFVNKATEATQSNNLSVEKNVLVKQLKSMVSPKIAGYFTNSFGIIADAYLDGWIMC